MGWVANASPSVDAQSQWRTLITISIILSTLSACVVSSRLLIRSRARSLAADDFMALLSMLFALTYAALLIVQTRYGLGLPVRLRPRANIIPYTRANFAGRPIYQLGISFFKVALCISYLRLLRGTDQHRYRLLVRLTIACILLAHLGCTLSLILACRPVAKSWNPLRPGTCLAAGPSFTGYAIVTIVSDIVVAVLPIPVLLRLNVPRSKKVGLIAIFLLGLFTTVCSVLRYSQINRIQYGDGNSTMLVLWGVIEFNVGNMVSSLPFLAPVFLRKAKEYRSKNSHSGGGGGGGSLDHNGSSGSARGDDAIPLGKGGCKKVGNVDDSLFGTMFTASQEDILPQESHHAIVKSVSYSIRVDDTGEPPGQQNIV